MQRRFADDEGERVVYYDLDADAHSRQLRPLSPDAVSAPPPPLAERTQKQQQQQQQQQQKQKQKQKQVFPRAPQPLFNLDYSGDEAEEENPFASLLQEQSAETATPGTSAGPETANSARQSKRAAVPNEQERPEARVGDRTGSSNAGSRRPILKQSQKGRAPTRDISNRKLGFEAADSRPSRWSSRKPSATDTNNRRRSLSAIQKRRSQLEASSANRRTSMPATPSKRNRSIMLDGIKSNSPDAPKRRLLSDVLQRANLLSQQQNADNDNSSFSQAQTQLGESPTDEDAILDTEHQMRAEPFAPEFFSPTKPGTIGSGTNRKSKSDAIISKIRGSIGEVVRKAVRKSNRDLTLLRSQGLHLLPQQSRSSLGTVESIQERPYLMVCTKRRCAMSDHFVAYECHTHEVAPELKTAALAFLKASHSRIVPVLDILFSPQTAEYLKLTPGKMLKIYEPLHFVPEQMAAGFSGKPNWLLLCTQLTEVVEEKHDCSG